MRSVHVVAHPEATHHVDRLVGGWYDSRLTPAGRQEAGAVARSLRHELGRELAGGGELEVHSSDLQRAWQTAELVGTELGVAPRAEPGLREKSYGVAEGRPQEWLDQRFVPPPADGDRMGHHEGVDGAETRGECARRVYAAMAEILRRPCPHHVVVTHGFALNFVVAYWIGMPYASLGSVSFRAPSGSITTLREDDFFHNRQLVRLGDTRHLDVGATGRRA